MASRIVCDCGAIVGINLFSGNSIFFMVDERTVEKIEEGVEVHSALGRMNHAVKCEDCSRHFLYTSGGKLLGVFTFEPI